MKDLSHCSNPKPRVLALFDKRLEGDDTLLELTQLRFSQVGMAAEFHATSPEDLRHLLLFDPQPGRSLACISGRVDLLDERAYELLAEFTSRIRRRCFGLMVRDQTEVASHFAQYQRVLSEINGRLDRLADPPRLYVQYASGLDPSLFISLFEQRLDHVGACFDIARLGLREARAGFARIHPGHDLLEICADASSLQPLVDDICRSVEIARESVINAVNQMAELNVPIHLQLHDAHPKPMPGARGVLDHRGFLEARRIDFVRYGKRELPNMFGPSGLANLIDLAIGSIDPEQLSMALEIYPLDGGLSLGEDASLFRRWTDKRNAEATNLWLATLAENYRLVVDMCDRAMARRSLEGGRRSAGDSSYPPNDQTA